MEKNELLSKISADDIIGMVTNYFGIPMSEDSNYEETKFLTMCHHDDPSEASFKLYFYRKNKSFYCYSGDGFMSLFDFVMLMKGISFNESIEFIEQYFHISGVPRGFGKQQPIFEIQPYTPKKVDLNEKLPIYDESILKTLIDYKAIEWLDEGISKETMERYGIKFDLYTNGIIIPHRDVEGNLVGIRERNLDEKQLELKRKYVPFMDIKTRQMFRHPLGKNLYGIHCNKERIKETKMAMLWESEKSTLKMDTIYGLNPSVSVGGSSISDYQLNLLRKNGCENIYVLFDYEPNKSEMWQRKMKKTYQKIVDNGFNCFYITNENMEQYLLEKESPIDRGQESFEILLKSAEQYIDK